MQWYAYQTRGQKKPSEKLQGGSEKMKKWLSVVLALSMLFSLCASTVWATEGSSGSSAPASKDVVYGSYKNDTWSEDANGTGTIVTDDGLTLSKTAKKTGTNEYEITLKVVSSSKTTTSADKAATVLVIDRSASMTKTIKGCQLVEHKHGKSCYECTRQNNPSHWKKTSGLIFTYYTHTGNCDYEWWNDAYYADTILCGKTEHTHSSNCQITRMSAAKNAALDFLDGFRDANGTAERWVAIVGFGTKVYDNAAWYNISTADGLTKAKNVVNALSAYSSDGPGGTNLDAGLRKANTLLADSKVQGINSKSVVALTDGEPTYYINDNGNVAGHGNAGCPVTNQTTATTAKSLSTRAGVYTVCLGAANVSTYEKGWAHVGFLEWHDHGSMNAPTVGDFLKNSIASKTENAFTADDSDSLRKAFSDISTSVTSGLGDGKGWLVTDPMPGYITVISKPNEFVQNGDSYTWTLPQVTGVTNEETGVTTYTYEITYTVKIKDTAGLDETKYHPTNKETTLSYGANNSQTACFPIPGVKVVNAAYTITYDKGEHGTLYTVEGDVAVNGQITFTGKKYGTPTPTLDESKQVKADDGWYFVGWDPAVKDTVTGDAIYTAQYASQNEIRIIPTPVEEYYNGAKQVATKYTVVGLPDGYNLTVDPKLSGEGTDAGEYPISVSNIDEIQVKSGNVVDRAYIVTADTNAKLRIKPLPITLTSETAEKVYDGEALTRPDVTVKSSVTGGEKVFLREATVKAEGTVTNVSAGRVDNSITISGISGMNYNEANYDIQKEVGTLRITPLKITLTSNDAEKVYDGKALTKDGVTVTSTNGKTDVFKKELANLEAIGSVVNVAECQANNNTISYTLKPNCSADNYSIEVKQGSLIIKPMMVTLTSETASKEYDGKALTRPDVKVTSSNGSPELFKSQVTGLKATGTITDPGTVDNTIVFTGNKEARYQDDNYIVDRSTGTLTVTKKGVQPAPDVTVTKTVDKATAKKGDTLTYTITVTNNSKEDLANLTLKDVMFNDKTQKTDTTTSWTKVIDKLEAGKSQTFTYTYKVVRDDVNTKVINVVTVTDGGQLSATAQATTSVTGGGNGGGTSTDTKTPVKSSSTGDMGIALYGAMALLSAGGMVWAGKKRRDER